MELFEVLQLIFVIVLIIICALWMMLWPGKPDDQIGYGLSRRGKHAGYMAGYMASKKRNKVPTVIANPRISSNNGKKSGRRNSAPAVTEPLQSPSKDNDQHKISKKKKTNRNIIFNPQDLENLTVQSGTLPSHRRVHESNYINVAVKDKLFDGDVRTSDRLNVPADLFDDIVATRVRSDRASADGIISSKSKMGNFGSLLAGGDSDQLGPDLTPYKVLDNSSEHSLKQNCNLKGNYEKDSIGQAAGSTDDHFPDETNSLQNSHSGTGQSFFEEQHVTFNDKNAYHGYRSGSSEIDNTDLKQFARSDQRKVNTDRYVRDNGARDTIATSRLSDRSTGTFPGQEPAVTDGGVPYNGARPKTFVSDAPRRNKISIPNQPPVTTVDGENSDNSARADVLYSCVPKSPTDDRNSARTSSCQSDGMCGPSRSDVLTLAQGPLFIPAVVNSSQLRQMAGENISDLIEQSHIAADDGDIDGARTLALKALVGACKEKDDYLNGLNPGIQEQQLADWFGECSFVFNKIGDYIQSARYFYTATLFDGRWTEQEHIAVSDVLWNNIVYNVPAFELFITQRNIFAFLVELDRIAKLAEKTKKWKLCLLIEADINRVYSVLFSFHGIGTQNIRSHPGRKEAMWRTARCCLQIGDHMNVKKVCSIILQEFCDYNDVEAFELWSKALCMSGDYDLALKKCELALQYCQAETDDRKRLEALRNQISLKIPTQEDNADIEPDQSWLAGTSAFNSTVANNKRSSTPDSDMSRRQKKHKRPKARSPSLATPDAVKEQIKAQLQKQEQQRTRKRSSDSAERTNNSIISQEQGHSRKNSKFNGSDLVNNTVRRLPNGMRSRHESHTSTTSSVSYDYVSIFDSDSDDETDVETTSTNSSLNTSGLDIEDGIEENEPRMDDNASFYEQSCRYYQEAVVDQNVEKLVKEDAILKHGVDLNMSYMSQFEDRHPGVVNRDTFYGKALSEAEMKEKILMNPQKYIPCTIQMEGAHEAFCSPVGGNHPFSVIEISGRSKIGQVFNEDKVLVELLDDNKTHEKRFGKVLGVLERQRHKDVKNPVFICTLDDMESHLVRPMCKTVPKVHIINKQVAEKYGYKGKRFKVEVYEYNERAGILCDPKIYDINPAGQKTYVFLVAYISWSPLHVYPIGAIIKILNWGNSIPKGLAILNLQHEVPSMYKQETVQRTESIVRRGGDEPSENMFVGRTDLTHLEVFTIDPPDAKDLDDALSIEDDGDGYRVGVHIADVSSFVEKDDPIDNEAHDRSTTFYPGIRRPRNMIPEPLGSNLCSLLPHRRRLTMSVFFLLDNTGRPRQMEGDNFLIEESFIRSRKQLSYGEAQKIIQSNESCHDNQLSKDIRMLFRLAKHIRMRRLGKSMYSINQDWEECADDESMSETKEAHYLVEEFMIMANKKIAEVLKRRFQGCLPIRRQPPPSLEGLQEFINNNGPYIDIMSMFQGKGLKGVERGVYNYLHNTDHSKETKTVAVSEVLWKRMKSSPEFAAKSLQTDLLFAYQHVIYQEWLSIQERAGYVCAASVSEDDGKHYSLGLYPYTHFTSPIRRYNDLVIHRLLRAYIRRQPSPYSRNEIENICVKVNTMSRRSKQYQRDCRALQEAVDLHNNPQMMGCFVAEVSDRGFSLCSPSLKHTKKTNRNLHFNLLDMGFKPEVFKDKSTNWDSVVATWRKRLYDVKGEAPMYPPDRDDLTLNHRRHVSLIPLPIWAKMVQSASDGRLDDLSRHIKVAASKGHIHATGHDDVSTECREIELLQPSTKFSMIFSRGQTVNVQMTAGPQRGLLAVKPMLFHMTNSVNLCLLHTDDPVLHFYQYVTNSTCDKYRNVKHYLERWLPLILMEAATGVVQNEESCCIKSRFVLCLEHCETRNIELSGTETDDEEEDDDTDSGNFSYDWLCLKAAVPNVKQETNNQSLFGNLQNFWIGHAQVTKVKKLKDSNQKLRDASKTGKLKVFFELHDKAPPVPLELTQDAKNAKYQVEILRKSEVDRRTETFIKKLKSCGNSLAVKIALNAKIPDLDRDHAHIVTTLRDRDLYFDGTEGSDEKPLPRNNKKQQEAIDKALTSRFTLIQGPPGTGKTYTGIKLMYLFDKINRIQHKEGKPSKQVLFCGPSNKSVDLVARWMLERMGTCKPNFVRVYGRSIEAIDFPIPGRTFLSKKSTRTSKADERLKSVTLHHLIREKGKPYAEEIKAMDRFFKKTNYAPMPEQARKYVHLIREACIDEIRKHDVILCTTAVGSNPKVLEATSVHQVIVDEAGMCPEPQCLVPIIATKAEQVVLIGDHKQLRPIIMCREAGQLGMETSLFERYATSSSSCNVQFVMLNEQYRMHPQICEFPSRQFYEKKLKTRPGPWCFKEPEQPLKIWPQDHYDTYPHVLLHVEGEEKVLTVSTEDGNEQSKSNEAEINEVIRIYRYLGEQTSYDKVCILSQYNAQCAEIRRRLKDEQLQEAHVSTVVSSQGGEWDYVIFSTVRSLPDYKIEKNPTLGWCKHNLGFITDRNQVNVALTRARKGLVIIGNKNLLYCDNVWRKLIESYEQRGCVMPADKFPQKGVEKSRLQLLDERTEMNKRIHGDTMFEPGVGKATFYEGPFDFTDDEDDSEDDYTGGTTNGNASWNHVSSGRRAGSAMGSLNQRGGRSSQVIYNRRGDDVSHRQQ
ncbi:helicase with zinc finger domain 2-like [Dreissena polymorpha]|uniref:helicase with zinc finger domain 2-like n=1 Tax=Dreissena polymorpha TaxID=45954 RepID=UPI0022643BEE|nr:helicase with zinc finger domain 2-like [Dreissena polymorpha]